MSESVRNYEAILIVQPDLGEEGVSKLKTQLGELAGRHGGRLLDASSLGRRKLSVRIGKLGEGLYLKARLQAPPAEVAGLEKAAGMIESIVRLMILRESKGSRRSEDGQSQQGVLDRAAGARS